LTLFGHTLYCARNRWGNVRPSLAEIAADRFGVIASNNKQMGGRIRSICNDAEIIALGERVHQAFPECSVLGVDIIRDSQTGATLRAGGQPLWRCLAPFVTARQDI